MTEENEEVVGLESAEEQEAKLPVEGLGEEPEAAPAEEAPKEVPEQGEAPLEYKFEDADDEYNGAVGGVARELGLSQEKAQKLVTAVEAANDDFMYRTAKSWKEELKKDEEIGGDKLDQNLKTARSVFDKYADDADFKRFLAGTGITNHPDFIRMFVRIGRDLKLSPKRSLFPHSRMED